MQTSLVPSPTRQERRDAAIAVVDFMKKIEELRTTHQDGIGRAAKLAMAQDPNFDWLVQQLAPHTAECAACKQPFGFGYRCQSCGTD